MTLGVTLQETDIHPLLCRCIQNSRSSSCRIDDTISRHGDDTWMSTDLDDPSELLFRRPSSVQKLGVGRASFNSSRRSSSFGSSLVPRMVNGSSALDLCCCFHPNAWMQRLLLTLESNPCVCQDGSLGLGEFFLRFRHSWATSSLRTPSNAAFNNNASMPSSATMLRFHGSQPCAPLPCSVQCRCM